MTSAQRVHGRRRSPIKPVERRGDAAVRRAPEPEGAQQEAELDLGLLLADAQDAEDPVLRRVLVDPDAAAADLEPVDARDRRPARRRGAGSALDRRSVRVRGRGEGMVARVPAPVLLVPLEEREVGDPERSVALPRSPSLFGGAAIRRRARARSTRQRGARDDRGAGRSAEPSLRARTSSAASSPSVLSAGDWMPPASRA